MLQYHWDDLFVTMFLEIYCQPCWRSLDTVTYCDTYLIELWLIYIIHVGIYANWGQLDYDQIRLLTLKLLYQYRWESLSKIVWKYKKNCSVWNIFVHAAVNYVPREYKFGKLLVTAILKINHQHEHDSLELYMMKTWLFEASFTLQ